MSQTYTAVDESSDPPGAVDWQEQMAGWPVVRAYKARTHELIGNRAPVLDVGCGPGADLGSLGPTRAIGVDPSLAMCLRAKQSGAPLCRAAVERLPFRDASLAACRTDRVLQHVVDPEAALAEMVRVTGPGGLIVAAEPDQESLVIRVPGVSVALCDQVKALRRDVGYRNGRLASSLPHLLAGRGLRQIGVEAFPLVITHPAMAFGLPNWPRLWNERGVSSFSPSDLAEWDAGIREAATNGLVYSLTFMVVWGTIPGARRCRVPTSSRGTQPIRS